MPRIGGRLKPRNVAPGLQRAPEWATPGQAKEASIPLSILQLIFDLIDMRSFSNLWYWIALAVTWSTASHWVLGVPFDMVQQARRRGGQAAEDMMTLTGVNVRRLVMIGREAGAMVALGAAFVLSSLVVLGFGYGIEFAQAVALLALPLAVVAGLSLRMAARIAPVLARDPSPEEVARLLMRHRLRVQVVGIVAITITALWGMFQNLRISILH